MVTSEPRLPDDPSRSGLMHGAIVVAGLELGSVVVSERPSYLFSSVLCVRDRRYALWAETQWQQYALAVSIGLTPSSTP